MLAQKREMQVAADGFSSPDGEGEEDIKPVSAAKHQAREPGRVVTRRASLLAQSEPVVAQESVRLVRKRMCMRLTLAAWYPLVGSHVLLLYRSRLARQRRKLCRRRKTMSSKENMPAMRHRHRRLRQKTASTKAMTLIPS
jgi:hypothetical protein